MLWYTTKVNLLKTSFYNEENSINSFHSDAQLNFDTEIFKIDEDEQLNLKQSEPLEQLKLFSSKIINWYL